RNSRHKFLLNRSHIGNKYFRYSGDDIEYWKLVLWNLFLVVITLGIYLPWYLKNTLQYRTSHTHFENATFQIDISGGDLLVYAIVGYFGNVVTLGLAAPWIINWGARLIINRISLRATTGEINVDDILDQKVELGDATGDAIVGAYDLDFG